MKKIIFLILFLMAFTIIISCNKMSPGVITTTLPSVTHVPTETISLKTGAWQVYPYSGGPGEDSLFFSWVNPYNASPNYRPASIIDISVKATNGHIYTVTPFITVSQKDTGYLYQLGDSYKLWLWWIQKQPSSSPDADSVIITFKQ